MTSASFSLIQNQNIIVMFNFASISSTFLQQVFTNFCVGVILVFVFLLRAPWKVHMDIKFMFITSDSYRCKRLSVTFIIKHKQDCVYLLYVASQICTIDCSMEKLMPPITDMISEVMVIK